jgi:AraC family ethanolamine operon transcriptional activator
MQFVEAQSSDFEELAAFLSAYDAQFRQLRGGCFQGKLVQLQIGPIVCMKVDFSHAIIAKGLLKQPAYVFTPVTLQNHRANWRGHTLSTQHLNVLGADEAMDHVSTADYSSTSIIISKAKMEDLAKTRWGFALEDVMQRQVGIRTQLEVHCRILEISEQAYQMARLGKSMDVTTFEEDVSRVLMDAFASIDPRLEIKISYNVRQKVIQRANDYILSNLHRIVSVTELCQAADCSERTLQYAFQERYGLSPKEYMIIQRLNAVRTAIKQAKPASRKLTEMAKSWGFSHPGDYAASYRRLFGELPSQTQSRYARV